MAGILWGAFLFYPIWLLFMLVMGLIMGSLTKGDRSQEWMEGDIRDSIQAGAVNQTQDEFLLNHFYVALLLLGIIFFYISIPIILFFLCLFIVGLLVAAFKSGGHLPILVVIVFGGLFWSILRGIFSFGAAKPSGIRVLRRHEPKLFRLTDSIAERIGTEPIDRIYLTPGSEIAVFQTGRGPFGIFGLKDRALILGLCTLHTLTVLELQSILAHEYAHFGHGDTRMARFIHQVNLSIDQTLSSMAYAGGRWNYINPVFWFLFLYYKAFELMAAGYSRSQEFLADRMAVALYGSNTFKKALVKSATQGTIMEECLMNREFNSVAEMEFKKQMLTKITANSWRNILINEKNRNYTAKL